MCDLSGVLWTLGILAALEALVVLFFTKWTLKLCKEVGKWKPRHFRVIGWTELLIAVILIIIALAH